MLSVATDHKKQRKDYQAIKTELLGRDAFQFVYQFDECKPSSFKTIAKELKNWASPHQSAPFVIIYAEFP